MDVAESRGRRLVAWIREGLQVPISAATLVVGSAAIALVILGPLAVVAAHGFTPFERIVAAFRSDATAIVLLTGMATGIAAIGVGFSIYKRMPSKRAREQALAGAILGIQGLVLGALFLWLRAGDPDTFSRHFLNFEKWEGYGGAFVRGAKNTVMLAFVGEAGGIVLGLVLAVLVLSERRVVRAPARTYINFFRGTPLIWQLSVFYFGFSIGLGFQLSAFTVAMIVFALNTGAYAAEVFRAGIQSIERGQMEAARSLGLTYMQSMRYAIVPQAIRRVIPPLMNEFVILIKDTSLVVVLGLLEREYDLFTVARQGYSETFNATLFVGAAIGYLVVTLPLIGAVNAVERRLRSGLVSVV
jgi:His/Glu/Gln/Arg/opine family amino acid ABC transporter permease subunit